MANSTYYEELKPFRTFSSIEEKDLFVRWAVSRFGITGSVLKVWFCLSSRAAGKGNEGVAKIKYSTLATLTELSISTVRRAISSLIKLGILNKVSTTRQKGGDGANIYVLQPVKQDGEQGNEHAPMNMREELENPDETSIQAEESEVKEYSYFKNASKFLKVFDVGNGSTSNQTKADKDNEELDSSYANNTIPQDIINALVPYTRKANTINYIWSKIRLAFSNSLIMDKDINSLDYILRNEENLHSLIRRLKAVVNAVKTGSARNFYALLYWHATQFFQEIAEEQAASLRRYYAVQNGKTLFKWL